MKLESQDDINKQLAANNKQLLDAKNLLHQKIAKLSQKVDNAKVMKQRLISEISSTIININGGKIFAIDKDGNKSDITDALADHESTPESPKGMVVKNYAGSELVKYLVNQILLRARGNEIQLLINYQHIKELDSKYDKLFKDSVKQLYLNVNKDTESEYIDDILAPTIFDDPSYEQHIKPTLKYIYKVMYNEATRLHNYGKDLLLSGIYLVKAKHYAPDYVAKMFRTPFLQKHPEINIAQITSEAQAWLAIK